MVGHRLYLSQISYASDKYGNKLAELMDVYNKSCLRDITLVEARDYYEKFIIRTWIIIQTWANL